MDRPVLRYFGGKWMLAPWIIEHFPEHRSYVEPFGGGGSVLLRKPRSFGEVYNDVDDEIVNVFRVLQKKHRALQRLLKVTPFARAEFDLAYKPVKDPVERARRTIVRSFLGFSAVNVSRKSKSGFRGSPQACHTHPAADWIGYPALLDQFAERLQGVVLENMEAVDLMGRLDSQTTLFYVDPPYVHGSRVESKGYRFEMTDQDHGKLLAALSGLKGMVVLSGYDHPLYDGLEDSGWTKVEREALAMAGAKRTESLWLNAAAAGGRIQGSLFARGTA